MLWKVEDKKLFWFCLVTKVVQCGGQIGEILEIPIFHSSFATFTPLGKPPFQKSAVFLNIVQKAFIPPPFYLNICPILQGVFFKRVFARGVF